MNLIIWTHNKNVWVGGSSDGSDSSCDKLRVETIKVGKEMGSLKEGMKIKKLCEYLLQFSSHLKTKFLYILNIHSTKYRYFSHGMDNFCKFSYNFLE